MEENLKCQSCGCALTKSDRFCSQCGKSIKGKKNISLKIAFITLIVGVAIWIFGNSLSDSLAGKKPTQQYVHKDSSLETSEKSALQMYKETTDKDPEKIAFWQEYVSYLLKQLDSSGEQNNTQMVGELIGALSQILKFNPKDEVALQMIAEFSFRFGVFDKAVHFYKRYLDVQPEDISVRANLGNALVLMGKFEEAEKELQIVLSKEPEHFQAMAYLSILFEQKGEFDKSKEIGLKALKYSPTEEARNRFKEFVDGIGKDKDDAKTVEQLPKGVKDYIASHPILKEKITGIDEKDDTIICWMKDFPIEFMPENVKTGLVKKIEEQLNADEKISVVIFKDSRTKESLLEVSFK